MLECADLSFSYQGVKRVDSVSLSAVSGCLLALYGHNGSGKSTLLKMLGGSLPVESGSVSVFQQPALLPNGYLNPSLRYHFGILFQGTSSDEKLSVLDNLLFPARLWGLDKKTAIERARWALSASSLEDRAQELVKKLSGGMRRRLELYRCFIHWPKIVLLDEPTAGLDGAEIKKFFAFLKNYQRETNATVIMASHHADELIFADHVVMMKDALIIANDTPSAMLAKLDYLRCSFLLAAGDVGALKNLPLFDWEPQPDMSTTAKLRTSYLDKFLQDQVLRDVPFKSLSIERPSLADVYNDLAKERHAQ